jgi:uncharacterized membrane protein
MSDSAGWARDLGLVFLLLVAANVVLFAGDAPWPVEWAIGVPFLLVMPGYAIVAALFPEDTGRTRRSEAAQPWHEPDLIVRTGLALLMSAVVVAAAGTLLGILGVLNLVTAVLTISAVTLIGLGFAASRRQRIDPATRAMPLGNQSRTWSRIRAGSTVQNAATVLALLVLLGTLGFTAAAPSNGDAYTEFYVLSENENGTLTASDYPDTFSSGESETLYVGLENQEHVTKSYEVVMLAQAVDDDGSVIIQQELDRFNTTLEHGENTTVERDIQPTIVGEDIRLRILLYEGEAPGDPSVQTADQSLHLWIDVTD